MSSIFAKIIAGEVPCYKIYEDGRTMAFLDIAPETAGHTLVVPKVEVDKIYELPDEDYLAVMETVKKVCRRMEEVLGKRPIIKVVGTDVPHAHVHIMPFDKNWKQGRVIKMSAEEMTKMAKKLAF